MRSQTVPRVIAKVLIPYIILFALYVQFHGDFGPGGGFQAGVILAAGLILYALLFGLEAVQRVMPENATRIFIALGVMIYGGVGVITMLMGGKFLDYAVLAHDPIHGQHYGIMFVELGVGLTVTAVMVSLFYSFAGRRAE